MEKSNKRLSRLFVTGTNTGVGKTVLSLLLMRFFYARGRNPFYIKPIQTGCNSPRAADSDSRFIYEHVAALTEKDPGESVIYCFRNPKAPLFAARDDGKEVDAAVIAEFVNRKSASHYPLIVEGAGGLFVPVSKGLLMIDLIGLLGATPILAARAGLGTINHTLLSLEALYKRGIEPAGIVVLDAGIPPAQPDMVSENMEAIEAYSGCKVTGVIGRIEDFSNPEAQWYRLFDKLFKGIDD